jgi:hypothetical protein
MNPAQQLLDALERMVDGRGIILDLLRAVEEDNARELAQSALDIYRAAEEDVDEAYRALTGAA